MNEDILKKAIKIKNIYLIEKFEDCHPALGTYSTGLILETEDGRLLKQCTTDCIEPYAAINKTV